MIEGWLCFSPKIWSQKWCVKNINLPFIMLRDAFEKINRLFHPNLCRFLDRICLRASHLLELVAMLCFLFQHVRLWSFKSCFLCHKPKIISVVVQTHLTLLVESLFHAMIVDWLCVSYQRFDHKVIDFWKGLWGDIVVCPHQKEEKTAGKEERRISI